MIAVELGCVAVIAFFLAMRGRTLDAQFSRRASIIAVAAWIGEETSIRLYGFYGYAPGWHLFLDRVPLLIVLIWPLVVLSSGALARHMAPEQSPARCAIITSALVFCDAAFIEPVAVRAGLWSWSVPGIFGVPLVGIAGWAFFGGAITYLLEVAERRRPAQPPELGALAAVALAAPLLTHGLLLASWWGVLRWLPRPLPDAAAPIVAAWISAPLAWRLWFSPAAALVPLREMVGRLGAAAFFFTLLLMHRDRGSWTLLAYAIAFAPPYFVLTIRAWSGALAGTPERAASR